jgi:hypothetical protein
MRKLKVTEVYYGGIFAVPAYVIMEVAKEPAVRQVMINLEKIMTRSVTTTLGLKSFMQKGCGRDHLQMHY